MADKQDLPLISVCIANYNGEDTIEKCVNSVLLQSCRHKVEILIHDDASTDNSLSVIAALFPDIPVHKSQSNVGYCISNNRLAAQAAGKYILLLNNDACLHNDALDNLAAHALANPNDAILSTPQFNMETGELIDTGYGLDIFLKPVPQLEVTDKSVAMVIGASLWIETSLWRRIGGFPEWFESIAEDMYLCLYAHDLGYGVKTLDTSGYDHLVGGSFGGGKIRAGKLSTTLRRRTLSERNKTFVMVLFFPAPILVAVLPVHLLSLLLEGTVLAVARGRYSIFSGIALHAIKSLWQYRHQLRRCRKRIQNERVISAIRFATLLSPIPHKLRLLIRHGLPKISR